MIKRIKFLPLLLLLVTLPTFISLIRPGFYSMQDDLQAFRLHQMDKCFQDFQIPCRWVPDMGYGYGYPQFEFYSPSVFYIGEVIHLLGFQFIDVIKILFILGFIISSFAMFIFLRSWLGDWPAFVGSVLYTYAPFKAAEVYVRGSLNEFWALSIVPLVFWSLFNLIKTGRIKYGVVYSLSIGLLLLTHNLMSMIFIPVVIIWAILWIYLERAWKKISKIIIFSVLGIGLAAFFILPIAFERQYVHIDSILSGYFDYRQHFVTVKELFLSNYFGYGSSVLGPEDDLTLSLGIVHELAAVIAVFLAIVFFKKSKKITLTIFIFAALELLITFLMHQRSSFIWEKINILSWLQFPWRFLGLSYFILSVLSAAAIYLIGLKKFKFGVILGLIFIIGVISLHINFFKPKDWIDITDKEKFSGASWEKQLTVSIFDYLPIYSTLPPNKKAPDKPEILEGEAEVLSYYEGSNFQQGKVNIKTAALIRLPIFDFPGMEVTTNDKVIEHNHDNCKWQDYCFGLISFSLEPGEYDVKVKLKDTPVRIIGNIVSLLSLIIVGIILLYGRKGRSV